MSEKKTNRRDFLFTATYAVGAVGVAASVWPMIDQMNPDASVKALASTEVDVSSVQPGQSQQPITIYSRTSLHLARSFGQATFSTLSRNSIRIKTLTFSYA